jgi:hypothetical protein
MSGEDIIRRVLIAKVLKDATIRLTRRELCWASSPSHAVACFSSRRGVAGVFGTPGL